LGLVWFKLTNNSVLYIIAIYKEKDGI